MYIVKLVKAAILAAVFVVSFNASASGLVSKAQTAAATEISGLGSADSKFVIAAPVAENATLERLAVNTVGSQGRGIVVERSVGCSVGCTVGCSVGCTVGCSVGCR